MMVAIRLMSCYGVLLKRWDFLVLTCIHCFRVSEVNLFMRLAASLLRSHLQAQMDRGLSY